MKYTLLCILFSLFSVAVFAQPASSIDVGAGVGISSYYGDINQDIFFQNPNMSLDGFIRYNFNKRYSLRVNVLDTKLEARDKDFKNPYQQYRAGAFEQNVLEFSAVGEVNFFSYQNPTDWGDKSSTIYALLGLGSATWHSLNKKNESAKSVVFGVGYKKSLRGRWAIEAEWAFRKCVTDNLDGIIDPIDSGKKSSSFNNDFYNVLGIRLVYNFWEKGGRCRTFEKDSDL